MYTILAFRIWPSSLPKLEHETSLFYKLLYLFYKETSNTHHCCLFFKQNLLWHTLFQQEQFSAAIQRVMLWSANTMGFLTHNTIFHTTWPLSGVNELIQGWMSYFSTSEQQFYLSHSPEGLHQFYRTTSQISNKSSLRSGKANNSMRLHLILLDDWILGVGDMMVQKYCNKWFHYALFWQYHIISTSVTLTNWKCKLELCIRTGIWQDPKNFVDTPVISDLKLVKQNKKLLSLLKQECIWPSGELTFACVYWINLFIFTKYLSWSL